MRKQPHPFLSVFCPYVRDPVTDKTENLENTLRAMMLRLPKEDLESWVVHTGNTGLSVGLMTLFRVQKPYIVVVALLRFAARCRYR